MSAQTPVTTDKPVDAALRQLAAPPTGLHYVIEGRPGRHLTVEEACSVAADLVCRLRLSRSIRVREAGSELLVALVGWDADGRITVIRLMGGAGG